MKQELECLLHVRVHKDMKCFLCYFASPCLVLILIYCQYKYDVDTFNQEQDKLFFPYILLTPTAIGMSSCRVMVSTLVMPLNCTLYFLL
jgi:hypothetical protein